MNTPQTPNQNRYRLAFIIDAIVGAIVGALFLLLSVAGYVFAMAIGYVAAGVMALGWKVLISVG